MSSLGALWELYGSSLGARRSCGYKIDQLITFYCFTEIIYRIWLFVIENKNIQAQVTDGLDKSQEQKYTGANDKTINLINYVQFNVTQKQG